MKKIFFVLFLSAATLFASAQYSRITAAPLTTTSYGNALDTVVNTAAKSTTTFRVSNWHTGVTAQVVVTKISGTVAGTLGLYGSMDGTNWSVIGSASTPSDATANYSFNTTAAWNYYRITYTGAGTMSASFKAFIMTY